MSAGKGSRLRPVNGGKFRAEHDRIFRNRYDRNYHGPSLSTSEALDRAKKGDVIDGHEYLGDGCWHTVDHIEEELREGE